MEPKTSEDVFSEVRRDIKEIAARVQAIRDHLPSVTPRENENRGEVMANVTLAYRHLEDASMRMGKAIQATNGGISVYDRATTVGA